MAQKPKLPVRTLQRVEFIADIVFSGAVATLDTLYNLPTQGGLLPNDRYMSGLRFNVNFRVTNPATNGPTGVQGDAPWSFIEKIRVSGTHRIRGAQEVFIDLRGSDLHEYNVYWYGRQPFSTPASLSTTANANNDVRMILDLPFVPENMPWWEQVKYLLDAPNYDSLKLDVIVGSDKSLFTGQTTAPTFTGFGGVGSPTISVSGLYAMGGKQQFAGYVPARVWRTFQEDLVDLVASNNAVRLFNINRGYIVRSLLLKTGVKSTAVNPGENVYNSLSNTILNNIKINRGVGRQMRHFRSFFEAQQDSAIQYHLAVQPDAGYALIDFANNEYSGEGFNTKQYIAGPTGEIDVFMSADTTGAANQAATLVTEELKEVPLVVAT